MTYHLTDEQRKRIIKIAFEHTEEGNAAERYEAIFKAFEELAPAVFKEGRLNGLKEAKKACEILPISHQHREDCLDAIRVLEEKPCK